MRVLLVPAEIYYEIVQISAKYVRASSTNISQGQGHSDDIV